MTRKYCMLVTIAEELATKHGKMSKCLEEACAFWNSYQKACCFLVLSWAREGR